MSQPYWDWSGIEFGEKEWGGQIYLGMNVRVSACERIIRE